MMFKNSFKPNLFLTITTLVLTTILLSILAMLGNALQTQTMNQSLNQANNSEHKTSEIWLIGIIDFHTPKAEFKVSTTLDQSLLKTGNAEYELNFYSDQGFLKQFRLKSLENSLTFIVPFDNKFKSLEVVRNGTILLYTELDLCNNNGRCDLNENYYSCPNDCYAALDNVCIAKQDNVCDPDCGLQDPDCVISNNSTSNSSIVKTESQSHMFKTRVFKHEITPSNVKTFFMIVIGLLVLGIACIALAILINAKSKP
ncbi:hypothetical protein J7L02_02390 [Candidatus Woesearchaeota archaeon]|nr:hypothetical protein [Candidatus Woesearchaeota archaeon]